MAATAARLMHGVTVYTANALSKHVATHQLHFSSTAQKPKPPASLTHQQQRQAQTAQVEGRQTQYHSAPPVQPAAASLQLCMCPVAHCVATPSAASLPELHRVSKGTTRCCLCRPAALLPPQCCLHCCCCCWVLLAHRLPAHAAAPAAAARQGVRCAAGLPGM